MTMRVGRTTALLLLALLSSACASRRLRREAAQSLILADARVLDGCYDCLLEARATYAQLAMSRYVNADTIRARLLEADLLLALRQKELGLDATDAMRRARESATRASGVESAERLVAIADAVRPDGTGRTGSWMEPLRRERGSVTEVVPGEVAWLVSAPVTIRKPVRDYLALALDCSWDGRVLAPRTPPGAPHRRPVLLPDSPPLIIYRTGICLGADTNMLAGAMALVPRYHEAAYYAGSTMAFLAEQDGGVRAGELLARALGRYPESTGVTYMNGWLARIIGECQRAVGLYDRTIGIDSAHAMAWLDRTICLSRTRQDSAAELSATRLIALGGETRQQGYYWRAVSRLRLRQLDSARADIEMAKALSRDENTLTIAGVIENEQNDLAVAETDLRAARAALHGNENCTAAMTLGFVLRKAQRPAESAAEFEAAMHCHDFRVSFIRRGIEQLRARLERNPAYISRRIDALVADSTDQRERYFAAAFNAAGSIANAGQLDRSLELLDVAAGDPRLATPIAELRSAVLAAKR